MNTVLPDLSVPPLTFFPSFADKVFPLAGSVLTLTRFFALLVLLLLFAMLLLSLRDARPNLGGEQPGIETGGVWLAAAWLMRISWTDRT